MKKILKLFIFFLGLCALIWCALERPDYVQLIRPFIHEGLSFVSHFVKSVADVLFTGPRILIVIALWIPLYWAYRENTKFNDLVNKKINALSGAGIDLVRLMETTTDGTAKKAGILDDTMYKFAVSGPAEIAGAFTGSATTGAGDQGGPGTGFVSANVISLPSDLALHGREIGDQMMNRRLGDMGAFSGNMANVRNGLAVFLMLLKYNNVQSAFFNMTEHMKKQRDDEKKKVTNFTELKVFFGLPTEYPEGDTPEKLQKAGLSRHEKQAILEALKRGRGKVLGGLLYNPPTKDDKKPITIEGENVLVAMRTFLYKADTYNPDIAVSSP
ncbi:MAG: hypothetical protein P8Y47_11910 [Alphaproteobacteria bacterium]